MSSSIYRRSSGGPDKPDLVVINPAGRKQAYQNLSDNLTAVESPIWVGLIAQYARVKGYRVEIIDANAFELSPEETAEQVAELQPLLTAVVVYGHNPNASTQIMPAASEVCRELKERDPEGRVILIGGHVASLPERTLREEYADFVCDGEGTVTISDLLEALRTGSRQDLEKVRGLCYFRGEELRHTASAPILTNLDEEMPEMAWDLLPMERYRAHNWHCFGGRERQPYAAMYTTLGCPFHCTFCCIQAPFKSGEAALGYKPNVNSYRRWSPANIVGQVDRLVTEYGVSNIKFADEIFVLHKAHVEQICDGLIAAGHDLNIWAYARVDTCTDTALLAKMREAGIRWLAIGIESAAEHVRDDVEKGYKPEKLFETIQQVQKMGIHVIGNYIFGLPKDDRQTMRQTLDFAKELNTEFANFYSAMAYPGSALYRNAIEKGLPLPATWDGYSQHSRSCLPLPTEHLPSAEVLQFRDAAFHEYFDRPEYREMVTQTFGAETVVEIDRMTVEPLARELLRGSVSV